MRAAALLLLSTFFRAADMSKTLIIAEKPSVATDLARVLGKEPVSYTHLDVYKRQLL